LFIIFPRSNAGKSSKLVVLFVAGVAYHALSCIDFVKCSTASSMSTAVLSGIFRSIVLSSICRNKFQFVFLFVKDGGLVHSTVEVLRKIRTGEWSDDKSNMILHLGNVLVCI
jgi:hypothetical protein